MACCGSRLDGRKGSFSDRHEIHWRASKALAAYRGRLHASGDTPSLISDDSNSAMAPMMANITRSMGLAVSI